jgi:hypothetical protein
MGVETNVRGSLVELHFSGSIAGREALKYADVVRNAAAECGSRVFVLTEFERGMTIGMADFTAACRASLNLQSMIGGLAMVTPQGFERTLARVGVAITNPPFEVSYFEETWRGRDWLIMLAAQSSAA